MPGRTTPIMTSSPAVSIVVLLYQSETTLERCVRSLFEQTLKDVEYVFVDDGSSDNSVPLLRRLISELVPESPDIKIVRHERNRGTGAARNSGLREAKGDYMIFCDSDDWIELGMYKKMYEKALAESADIVGCDFYREEQGEVLYSEQRHTGNGKQCAADAMTGKLFNAMWNKLVRKNLYDKNSISFSEELNLWEDGPTIIRLYLAAKRIAYVPEALYHYCIHSQSVSQNRVSRHIKDPIKATEMVEAFLKEEAREKEFAGPLCQLKFQAKHSLLNKKGIVRWITIFPESNKMLIRHLLQKLYRECADFLTSTDGFGCLRSWEGSRML